MEAALVPLARDDRRTSPPSKRVGVCQAAMPQIFRHSTNYLARTTIFGAIFILFAALWVTAEIARSGWNTGAYIERQQPIQFSHKHHVGDDGIDCRYCHTSVETSASAGMPATAVCMTAISWAMGSPARPTANAWLIAASMSTWRLIEA